MILEAQTSQHQQHKLQYRLIIYNVANINSMSYWLCVRGGRYIYFLIVCRGRGYIYFSFVWYLIFIFTHHTILLQHTTWTVHTVGVASTYNIEQWYVYKYMSEDFTQQCWKYMFLLTVFGTYTFNKTHHLFAYQNEEHFSSPRRRPPQ